MALHSVHEVPDSEPVTKAAEFHEIPVSDACLFAVRPGLPAEHAASTIHCLADGIEGLALDATCSGDGMNGNMAYLVRFAAAAISALSESLGA